MGINLYLFLYQFQVVPSKVHLEAIGHQLGKVLNYTDLILDNEVQEAVLKELSKHGKYLKAIKFDSELTRNWFLYYFDLMDSDLKLNLLIMRFRKQY